MASKEREAVHPDVPRRKALKVAVSALCSEVGFGQAEHSAVETLAEMIQSYIQEVGRSARAYAELSSRTVPMCSDVSMALIDMGMDIKTLPAYAERQNKSYLIPPGMSSASNQPRVLQVGDSKDHPSHIPEHLPAFPDPHTYIQTLTNKKPITEYQLIREKAASQKRDVERALTRFIAKTGDTEKLFEDDPYAFPLIACKPSELPYIDALLPKDEDLEAQEMEEKKLNQQKQQQKQQLEESKEKEKEKDKDSDKNAENEQSKKEDDENKEKSPSEEEGSGQGQNEEGESSIDNPYLRPIKMPRLKGGKSTKSKW